MMRVKTQVWFPEQERPKQATLEQPKPRQEKPKEPDAALHGKRVRVVLMPNLPLIEGSLEYVGTYMLVLKARGKKYAVYKHAIAWIEDISKGE